MNKPMFETIGIKDLDFLLAKINETANINIQNNFGNTALILASNYGRIEICKLLIEYGADLNIQNIGGKTALKYAFGNENIKICKLLIENGADVNIQNNDGETLLITASRYKRINICKLLIEKGADINLQDKNGNTALIYASGYDYINICKLLIESGSDINIENNEGKTAIDLMKIKKIYEEIKPYKIIKDMGIKYFKEKLDLIGENIDGYLDIFNSLLYNENLDLKDIKANIDMFYSTIIVRMDNNAINESVEL